MTNATEQPKREMYADLKRVSSMVGSTHLFKTFQDSLEAHLEELRKDSMDTLGRLVAMTQERDDIQLRLHAVDHAYSAQSTLVFDQAAEINRHKVAINIAGEELIRVQGIARQHLDDCRSAEKLSDDLYVVKNQRKAEPSTSAQDSKENVASEMSDGKAMMVVLGAMVDIQQIVSDWAVCGHKSKEQMRKLANVLNGDPELQRAIRSFENGGCMHSFHPAFPGGEQCIFCGGSRELPQGRTPPTGNRLLRRFLLRRRAQQLHHNFRFHGEHMSRMEKFELIWAAQHAVPAESLVQYRWIPQEGYRLLDMAAHFRTFCQTLDSVVVELPSTECFGINSEEVARVAIDGCADAINDAGINWVRA